MLVLPDRLVVVVEERRLLGLWQGVGAGVAWRGWARSLKRRIVTRGEKDASRTTIWSSEFAILWHRKTTWPASRLTIECNKSNSRSGSYARSQWKKKYEQ